MANGRERERGRESGVAGKRGCMCERERLGAVLLGTVLHGNLTAVSSYRLVTHSGLAYLINRTLVVIVD